MRPGILDLVPDDTYYGVNELIQAMLEQGLPVSRYLMQDYWLDIGRIEDYQQAEDAYRSHFSE